MSNFWGTVQHFEFTNEASVETRLIIPLLNELGYINSDIFPKYPIIFQEGRKGRKPEADFVVFCDIPHDKNTSLIVIEAKAPTELLEDDAKTQAESYTANIRAPFFLLTNGRELEIWQFQLTSESECILRIPINELHAYRGKIESYLSKSAAIEYAKSLYHKNIMKFNHDVSKYINAELGRIKKYQNAIERTLTNNNASSENKNYSSHELLSCFPNGAIILAHSGLGKTTLSYKLFQQSLQNVSNNFDEKLAFEISLSDLVEIEQTIIQFIEERLISHHPNITEYALKDICREKGIILLCDSFDRVPIKKQKKIEIELNNLRRDFPKIQLFIFSRSTIELKLELPTLKLEPLNYDEKIKLKGGEIDILLYSMPQILLKLSSNPLLLIHIVEFYQKEKKLPFDLKEVFQFWLEQLLNTDSRDNITNIDKENALYLLANQSIYSPFNKIKAISLLRENHLSDSIFSDLIQCEAININGSIIEFQHEALADYLRALYIASLNEENLILELNKIPLEKDSFFPILLIQLLPSRHLQRLLWKRLTSISLPLYLSTLYYRSDTSKEITEEKYLEDLLEGVEFPLDGFFSDIKETIIEQLTGKKASRLAITGRLNKGSNITQPYFSFHPFDGQEINVGSPSGQYFWVNLEESKYRLDSGRLIGAKRLKESILKIIENRQLKGGKIWVEERLIGRLRYLKFPLEKINYSLDELELTITSNKIKNMINIPYSGKQKFNLNDLLEDIIYLKNHGQIKLELWWERLKINNLKMSKNEITQLLLNEYYRRLQLAYKEIVENSFKSISHEFHFYWALPVRYKLAVTGRTFHYQWLPVSSWDQIGADVEFCDSYSISESLSFSDVYDALSKLGRTTCNRVTIGERELIEFDFYEIEGETPIIHWVCKLILEDIKYLFSELPSRDEN